MSGEHDRGRKQSGRPQSPKLSRTAAEAEQEYDSRFEGNVKKVMRDRQKRESKPDSIRRREAVLRSLGEEEIAGYRADLRVLWEAIAAGRDRTVDEIEGAVLRRVEIARQLRRPIPRREELAELHLKWLLDELAEKVYGKGERKVYEPFEVVAVHRTREEPTPASIGYRDDEYCVVVPGIHRLEGTFIVPSTVAGRKRRVVVYNRWIGHPFWQSVASRATDRD